MERAQAEGVARLIIMHEGFRQFAYDDSDGLTARAPKGKLTIGYGRNLESRGLSQQEAMYLLMNDVADCHGLLKNRPWFYNAKPARQAALIDMCYNMGFTGLMGFRKMIAAMVNDDWDLAADEALDSRWADQVGRRARNIAHIFRTGRILMHELER